MIDSGINIEMPFEIKIILELNEISIVIMYQ